MKIENRQQMLVIAAGVGLALLIGDSFILQPLTKTWKERTKRITSLTEDVSKAKEMIKREVNIRSRWTEMRTNTLSADVSVASQQMLTAFDRWFRASGITVNNIRVSERHTSEDYLSLETRVDATGSLQTITQFLYNLEKDPMAVKVEAVELAARTPDGRQFTLGLTVSGLVLTPGTEK